MARGKKPLSIQKERPLCKSCGKTQAARGAKNKNGIQLWLSVCNNCKKIKSGRERRPYRKHVGSFCSFCGFIPIHLCQLDVDHIDGNHNNNSPENLQTLCANCHRLKTYLNRDWEK